MNARSLSWLTLPMLVLLAACSNSGGGDGVFESPGTTARVYVANGASNDVSGYSMNPTTGALTALTGSPFSGVTNPTAIAISPNSALTYVANQGGSIAAFTINSATGVLTAAAGSPFAAGTNPRGVAVSPNGQFLYAANGGGNVSAFSVTPGTGVLTAVSGSPFGAGNSPAGVAVSPNGSFLYVANENSNDISAYTINGTTGALSAVGGSPFAAGWIHSDWCRHCPKWGVLVYPQRREQYGLRLFCQQCDRCLVGGRRIPVCRRNGSQRWSGRFTERIFLVRRQWIE
ncbi:MAG: lactonase family protein [Nitrospiraceae bacterium]|nr:lactonase family protein [Nitrospiraceae bacterium]